MASSVSHGCPPWPFPSILLSTQKTRNLTGGQEAFANAPFNAFLFIYIFFFRRAMEELRGKARIAGIAHSISCGFIILLLTNFEFHEACGFPTAFVCGEDTFQ